MDLDVTADGCPRSRRSLAVLDGVSTPVELVVVVTDASRLPSPLQLRAKELIDMSYALERARHDLVQPSLRPEDRLDEAGSEAIEIHGVSPCHPSNRPLWVTKKSMHS